MSEQVFTNLTNCGPVSVYVNDGVVSRIRPLVADDEAEFRPWVIEADGKRYSPPRKFNLAPMAHAERRRLYSDDRIKYPMKRVDFDPNGERNPQNRGKSAYERISWDEALDIVSGEIARVKRDLRQLGDQRHDLLSPQLGHRRLQDGPLHALHELSRGHPRLRQPGQLGGVALGRHPHVRLLLAPRHARAVRQSPGRDAQLRDDRLLVQRPRHHARDVLGSGVGHLADVAQGEGRPGRLHRPLPQLHQRDLRRRQVDRAAHGHGHGAGDGDRLRVDHRGHLRQGVRRRPHHRLRRVQALRARRDGRRAQDAGVGGRGERRRGARHPHAGPGVGRQAHRPRGRRARRRGQRLPHCLRHGVGADDGAPPGHAGPRQARHHHRGRLDGRAGRVRDLVPGLRRADGPHVPLDEGRQVHPAELDQAAPVPAHRAGRHPRSGPSSGTAPASAASRSSSSSSTSCTPPRAARRSSSGTATAAPSWAP